MANFFLDPLPLDDDQPDPAPRRVSDRCQCGDDVPGTCPGPTNCLFSDQHDD